jgi:hypothetical protein
VEKRECAAEKRRVGDDEDKDAITQGIPHCTKTIKPKSVAER